MFRSLDFLKNVIIVPIRNNFAILFCRNALRGHLQMKQTKIPLIMRNLELLCLYYKKGRYSTDVLLFLMVARKKYM